MSTDEEIKAINEVLEMQKKNDFKKGFLEFYTAAMAKAYDKASTYSNLIMIAGYATYFNFWNNVKNDVDVFWGKISVLLVLVSSVAFIVWEISKMIISASSFMKTHKLENTPPEKFQQKINEINNKEQKLQLVFARYWIVQLCLTIIPGFIGAIILIYLYAKPLFK